jgi:hypothetical protein
MRRTAILAVRAGASKTGGLAITAAAIGGPGTGGTPVRRMAGTAMPRQTS